MKPNSITVSRSKRGTTIKATGAAANALFDRMAAEVDGITTPEQVGPCTVHFEDHFQDFLEWDIDANGVVIDSRPFQAWCWNGSKLLEPPRPGQCLRYVSGADGKEYSIRYPVSKVTQLITNAVPTTADKLSP